MARSDVRMLYLSSRVVSSARRAMVAYRVKLDEVRVSASGFAGPSLRLRGSKPPGLRVQASGSACRGVL